MADLNNQPYEICRMEYRSQNLCDILLSLQLLFVVRNSLFNIKLMWYKQIQYNKSC